MGAAGLTARELEEILTGMMMRFGAEWTRQVTDALAGLSEPTNPALFGLGARRPLNQCRSSER